MINHSVQAFANILKTTSYSDGRVRTMKEGSDGAVTVNIIALNPTEKALARAALDELSTFTGLRFRETTGRADITYDNAGTRANTKTVARGDTINTAEINIGSSRVDPGDGPGSFAFRTYMHETAHALGLGHPQDYGVIREFHQSRIANDSWQISIMSYFDQNENTRIDASKAYHLTPMISDYVAFRDMYGANPIHVGNTTYGVGSTAGGTLDKAIQIGAGALFLIVDTQGQDRISFATRGEAQRIDLRPGAISDVMGGRGNMQIATDTLIEHAVGGRGADVMFGNAVNNMLQGGAGNDVLHGLAGNDTLDGGAGRDVLYGGPGNDVYVVTPGDRVIETRGQGIDLVRSAGSFALGGWVEHLVLTGAAPSNGVGNALNNTIIGNAASNVLSGGMGNDRLDGGAGIDTALFSGTANVTVDLARVGPQATGHGIDTLLRIENVTSGSGNDNLSGNHLANVLNAGAGNDVLNGRGGRDVLIGGAGNDRYIVGPGDRVVETAGQGYDTVLSAHTCVLAPNVEVLSLTGRASVNGWGNAGDSRLNGNAGDNGLVGLAGNDYLRGGAGSDRLNGGAGRDTLDGGVNDGARDFFIFNDIGDSPRGIDRDVIHNFEQGLDLIQLSGIDADITRAGDQAFVFSGVTPTQHAVWYATNGRTAVLRADVDGDAVADFEVQLVGIPTLDGSDFIL